MCDTILAPPDATAQHVMVFGKNSDRQRNEAQSVEFFPAANHAAGSALKCQYLSIPQVEHTNALLICRQFWAWGGEMGANEHGVAVGNEAVHARIPPSEDNALTGNDLIRLALERASTAAQAVEVIKSLLEQYGQGGNCGHLTPSFYNNGFMIADPREGYVLETLGREWLVERVDGIRSISNRYSIGRNVHSLSKGLPDLIRASGWESLTSDKDIYSEVLANPDREHLGNAGARRACSTSLMKSREGRLGAMDMMSVLRDHGAGDRYHPEWRDECATTRTVCMHAGAEDRNGHTANALISELREKDSVHWVTGTAAPCTSIFKPVLLDVPLPSRGPRLTDRFDENALWWRHERLHRAAVMGDFGRFLEDIRPERDALEAQFQARVKAVLQGGTPAERARVIAQCWQEAADLEDRWYGRIDTDVVPPETPYTSGWKKMNRLAGL